ncbi:hypothetical protein Ae201684P_021472 [Aphanomyces euteiches]|nr:hypothetical protein Ae201684P_021472 [Aphanomyces euteiches]
MAEQDDLESWDIERDLHFLIATDEQLETELDHMCSLLIDASSDASVESNASPSVQPTQQPTKRKGLNSQPVSRRKKEMFELQRQVKVLKDELETAKYQAAMQREMSCWEKAARSGRKQLFDRKNEVSPGQEAPKKPRPISGKSTSSLRVLLFALLGSTQLRTGNSVVWTQLSSMLACGVSEKTELLYVLKRRMAAKHFALKSFATSSSTHPKTSLRRQRGQYLVILKCNFQSLLTIEMIDPCTLYEMNEVPTPDGVICHSNIIRKAYMDEDRHVMLSRTVLHDALAPQMMHRDVEDERLSWKMTIQIHSSAISHFFSMFRKFTQITLETTGQGLLPKESQEAAWKAFPPSMEAFSKNGKEFGKYLLQVIKQAVKSFHESKPSSCPSE